MILGAGGVGIVASSSFPLVAGADEAGRGPLAGPVVAAAVMLDPDDFPAGLRDSKALSARKRERLASDIRVRSIAWAIAACSVAEIEELNILHASMLAMRRAVEALSCPPSRLVVDGNRCPTGLACPATALVGGDAREPAISAASILAKTQRDQLMLVLHERYPQYAFDRHKGYPTPAHLDALRRHGACPEHRRSFAPVKAVLDMPELPF